MVPIFYLAMEHPDQPIASWVFYVATVNQFVYQTLDAVDGKHARNTKQSSPLGALVDHGCDGILIFVLAALTVLNLKNPHSDDDITPLAVVFCLLLASFYV